MTIDTAEAARRLGLTRRRITALIRSGKLPAKRIGERVWLLELADLKLVKNRKPGRPKN